MQNCIYIASIFGMTSKSNFALRGFALPRGFHRSAVLLRPCAAAARLLRGLAFACALLGPEVAQAQEASLVRVDPVRQEVSSQTVPVVGQLVARQAGEVAAQVAGPVEAFLVEVGDRVEKDAILAVINADVIMAERDLSAGRLAVAKAQLETARAEIKLAQHELDRMTGLKTSAAFSKARYEDAEQGVIIAQARSRAAAAAVANAQSDLRLYELNLADTEVLAPYAGVITRRLTEAGAYVRIGDPLVYMISDQNLEIEADVPFQRLNGLDRDRAVNFTLDDGSHHTARVRAVLPSENPLTRTRTVRFLPDFNGIETSLADSQSVTVRIPVGADREVLTVHKDAILQRQGHTVVYVVKDGKAESRSIVIGEGLGSRVEVISGLSNGESVVVRGNERLRPGAEVRIDGAS